MRRPDAEAGRFAALAAARAAVRQTDGAAAAFSPVEESIATALGVGIAAASGAWEDAWLAAGALRARIDSTRDAARSRLLALPAADLAAAMELEEDLAAAVAANDARWDAVIVGLARAGRRVAAAAAAAGSASRAARPVPAAEAEPPPIPGAAAVAVAVPIPIRPPDRVTIVVATAETPAPPVLAAAAAAPPTAIGASRRVVPPVSAPVAGVPPRPIRPPGSQRRPADTTAAAPITPVQVAPRRPGPPVDRHEGRRRRGAVAGVLLVGTLALGGGLLARAIGELGAESGSTATRDSDPRVVVGSSGPSSARPGSASSLPPASPIQTGISPALLVNFDLTPVGPLDPGEPPIARAIGDPQISPFPTPFDRSLRLTGPAAGVCVRLPADAARPLSAMTFDLYLGEAGSGGRIIIGAAALDPAHGGLALDLATLDALDREAWYRLVVTRPGDATGVAVRSTGGGRLLLEAELEADPAIEPTSPGEACLSSSLPTAGASLFVDNLRLDR